MPNSPVDFNSIIKSYLEEKFDLEVFEIQSLYYEQDYTGETYSPIIDISEVVKKVDAGTEIFIEITFGDKEEGEYELDIKCRVLDGVIKYAFSDFLISAFERGATKKDKSLKTKVAKLLDNFHEMLAKQIIERANEEIIH